MTWIADTAWVRGFGCIEPEDFKATHGMKEERLVSGTSVQCMEAGQPITLQRAEG